ncbi:MAG: ribosome silencing factor [Pseudomonadota bacterium]|nr:ribosome silencing factor [Pseudomonadota bacterium]
MKNKTIDLCNFIKKNLSKNKAQEITVINLKKKTSIADYMIICTGTSNRHITALSNYLSEDLKRLELNMLNIEGKRGGDWIIVDIGDIIIHLFRSEVREYYNLEKMWTIN